MVSKGESLAESSPLSERIHPHWVCALPVLLQVMLSEGEGVASSCTIPAFPEAASKELCGLFQRMHAEVRGLLGGLQGCGAWLRGGAQS